MQLHTLSPRSRGRLSRIIPLCAALILLLGVTSACSSPLVEQNAKSASAAKSEPRVIKHQAGETTIPADPQKIAVLDYRLADSLLALGIKPYAMTTYLGETTLPWIQDKPLTGVIPLGDTANLEAVLQAGPDFIVGRSPESKIYEQLNKIAPTAIVDVNANNWRQNFLELAGYLQRDKEANQWLADYDKKAAAIRTELARYIKPEETFLYLRIMPKEIRVHGTQDLLGATLFQDLKLTPVPGLEKAKRVETISLEKLLDYNADHIFIEVGTPTAGGDKDAENNLINISQTAVWKNLNAVKQGHVYTMPQWIISDYPNIKSKSLDLILENLKK